MKDEFLLIRSARKTCAPAILLVCLIHIPVFKHLVRANALAGRRYVGGGYRPAVLRRTKRRVCRGEQPRSQTRRLRAAQCQRHGARPNRYLYSRRRMGGRRQERSVLAVVAISGNGLGGGQCGLPADARPGCAVEDCRCALRWVIRNAAKYNLDVNKLVVTGESAGSHLALTTGMLPASAGLDGNAPARRS